MYISAAPTDIRCCPGSPSVGFQFSGGRQGTRSISARRRMIHAGVMVKKDLIHVIDI